MLEYQIRQDDTADCGFAALASILPDQDVASLRSELASKVDEKVFDVYKTVHDTLLAADIAIGKQS